MSTRPNRYPGRFPSSHDSIATGFVVWCRFSTTASVSRSPRSDDSDASEHRYRQERQTLDSPGRARGPRIGWGKPQWRGSATPPRNPSGVRPTSAGSIVAAIGVAVVGVWAQSQSEIDANFFTSLNDLSGVDGVFKAVYALGSIWALGAVALVLLVFRQVGVAWRVALAGALAWGVAELLHEILPAHSIAGSDVNVRIGDGPVYPTTNVAIITALAVAFAPYAVRPLRRILFLAHPVRGGRRDVPRRGIPVRRARWAACSGSPRAPRSWWRSARPPGGPRSTKCARR